MPYYLSKHIHASEWHLPQVCRLSILWPFYGLVPIWPILDQKYHCRPNKSKPNHLSKHMDASSEWHLPQVCRWAIIWPFFVPIWPILDQKYHCRSNKFTSFRCQIILYGVSILCNYIYWIPPLLLIPTSFDQAISDGVHLALRVCSFFFLARLCILHGGLICAGSYLSVCILSVLRTRPKIGENDSYLLKCSR